MIELAAGIAVPVGARIAVVGGGVSGIVTARALVAAGYDVTLFEQRADLGGVWSASRAYPGISTQDDRTSYTFSDAAMGSTASDHPTGAEVRGYLERYAEANGVRDRIRLGTRVVRAQPTPDGWRVESEGAEGTRVEDFEWLVAANGVFSAPHVPSWPGRDAFEAAGGTVVEPGLLADGAALDHKRVVVVGWGKTACDLAVVAAQRGTATSVVARTLTWKYPKRVGRRLTFHHLVLTRGGERFVATPYRSAAGRLLLRRLPERLPRKLLGRSIGDAIDRGSGLTALGLRPTLDLAGSTSLVTDGFFEAVAEGRIRVHREQSVTALGADEHGPWARLSDGERIPADVVVAATGYEQRLEFLPDEVLDAARDEDGMLRMHRRILAVDVPRLAFIGWTHTYRSPLTSEVSAWWLAGVLRGRVRLPAEEVQRRSAARLRINGGTTTGRSDQLPGASLRELDLLLADLGVALPRRVRLRQWWRTLDPSDYAAVLRSTLPADADAPATR